MDPLYLKNQATSAITNTTTLDELENIRLDYLNKNGLVNEMMQQVTQLSPEKRASFGKLANQVKNHILKTYQQHKKQLSKTATKSEWLDVTLPGTQPAQGHLHLVTQANEEIADIFEKIGFVRVRYPEAEWDWFAFESLNMPANHPARDEWETLFLDTPIDQKYGKMVLTPHTSNGQIREMQRLKSKPPIRMINIAKCYRRQQDVTHLLMFHQFEGLVVDKNINLTHLKGTLDHFAKKFYGEDRKTRLRPFHFQFTEPSFEVDINCAICLGKGTINGKTCRTCKQGWHELGGAGMVHPNVLAAGGIDPTKYTGFAFGLGPERAYMMRSSVKINDIRMIYGNDVRFLNQF